MRFPFERQETMTEMGRNPLLWTLSYGTVLWYDYPSSKDRKGGYAMKNKLTAAQVQLLRANIYVENATENYVGLTEKAITH